jgi:hypothetical protein
MHRFAHLADPNGPNCRFPLALKTLYGAARLCSPVKL